MESRNVSIESLPEEISLAVFEHLDFASLDKAVGVSKFFLKSAIITFEDKQKALFKRFKSYKQSTKSEELGLHEVEDIIFWLKFIPWHLTKNNMEFKGPIKLQQELLFLGLLLCELMLYLTEHKIIMFNAIKTYARRLIERTYVPQFVNEYENVPVLGQLNRKDVSNIKEKILYHMSGSYLEEMLNQIKHMQIDCRPTKTSARFFSFFSTESEQQARLWKMVDKCIKVINESAESLKEEDEEESKRCFGFKLLT